jgi:hypothetical protein
MSETTMCTGGGFGSALAITASGSELPRMYAAFYWAVVVETPTSVIRPGNGNECAKYVRYSAASGQVESFE